MSAPAVAAAFERFGRREPKATATPAFDDLVSEVAAALATPASDGVLLRALKSIAANTCCEGCQEAARVARAALAAAQREQPTSVDLAGSLPVTDDKRSGATGET